MGQVVFLSGRIITGRDAMHARALSSNDVTDDLNGATLFHSGPIVAREDNGWKVIAAGPTTSSRMDHLMAEMIRRHGIRAVIGKGGMSEDVLEEMANTGCVYLAAVGGTAVSLAEGLKVIGVKWEDLGMAEAMWTLEAERLGPLTVAMDAKGNSIYKDVGSKVRGNIKGPQS